jgi:hypothetical protein
MYPAVSQRHSHEAARRLVAGGLCPPEADLPSDLVAQGTVSARAVSSRWRSESVLARWVASAAVASAFPASSSACRHCRASPAAACAHASIAASMAMVRGVAICRVAARVAWAKSMA